MLENSIFLFESFPTGPAGSRTFIRTLNLDKRNYSQHSHFSVQHQIAKEKIQREI